MLALGIIVSVLPALIVAFKGGNTASAATIYGLFGSVWAAMQFLFSPVLGSLSDRFGRRRVILLSNLGLGLDHVLMAMAPSLWWLFVGRVISGITSSSFSTAGAYIADVTPPAERAAKFGMLGAAFGVGFIVGPSVGGLLGRLVSALEERRALATGFVCGVAGMAAPIIFTQTFAEAVGRFRSSPASGAPFLLAAALLVAALVTGLRAESGSPTRTDLAEISPGARESVGG